MLIEFSDYSCDGQRGSCMRIERKIDNKYVIDSLFFSSCNCNFFVTVINLLVELLKSQLPISQKYTSITNAHVRDWDEE